MNQIFKTIPAVALCLFFCCQTGVAQSPWVRSKGGFYSQVSYQFIPTYYRIFSRTGQESGLEREISEGTAQFYGEYGLSRRTTIVGSLPFRFITSGKDVSGSTLSAGSISGLGNVSLAIRHNFLSKNVTFSGTIRAELPASKYDDPTGLRTGYNAFTLTPMLNLGMGFRKFYWFAYAGYGLRGNDYSHVINAGVEGGAHLGKLWLIGFSELVHSLENGDVELPLNNWRTALYVDDQGYLSLGLKGIYEFNRFAGVVASFAGAASAQLLPRSPGIGLGAYFKWD